MANRYADLASNVNTTVDQPDEQFLGGRAALVICASSFPTTCQLEMLLPDGQTWVAINSTSYSQSSLNVYDLPASRYRMHLSGGTTTGLYAKLLSIPYT